MALIDEIRERLREKPMAKDFTPYLEFSKEADALNVYFRPDPDYSKRLTDHVTLYLSLESQEIVGCRLKGISGILEDLPNFVSVDDGERRLRILLVNYRSEVHDEFGRQALLEVARHAGDLELQDA